MSEEVFESIIGLLEECNLKKTVRMLRHELKQVMDIVVNKDREKNLISKSS